MVRAGAEPRADIIPEPLLEPAARSWEAQADPPVTAGDLRRRS